MFNDIQQYIIEKSWSIDGYLWAILIGSEATWFTTEDSDIDIHVFVDWTQKKSSIWWCFINNRTTSIIIYPIDIVLKRITNMAKVWSNICKRMYDVQWIILDDPYMIVSNIKETSNMTIIEKGYTEQDLRFIIWWLQEFQRILKTLNSFARNKLLFHVFDQYSFSIWYDHYSEFWLSFWKISDRIFNDDNYALKHRWKIYPEKEFIKLWIDTYNNCTTENLNQLLNYSTNKLIWLL